MRISSGRSRARGCVARVASSESTRSSEFRTSAAAVCADRAWRPLRDLSISNRRPRGHGGRIRRRRRTPRARRRARARQRRATRVRRDAPHESPKHLDLPDARRDLSRDALCARPRASLDVHPTLMRSDTADARDFPKRGEIFSRSSAVGGRLARQRVLAVLLLLFDARIALVHDEERISVLRTTLHHTLARASRTQRPGRNERPPRYYTRLQREGPWTSLASAGRSELE